VAKRHLAQRSAVVAVLVVASATTLVLSRDEGSSGLAGGSAPGAGVATVPTTAATGDVTVSPAPGSRTADPSTQLSFLGRPASSLGTITVVGSRSGPHVGKLRACSTGDGASFLPDKPFDAGEQVTVRTTLPIAGSDHGTYRLVVAHVVPLRAAPSPPALATDVPGVDHLASAPGLEPPVVSVDAKGGRSRKATSSSPRRDPRARRGR
jgi:hypothetical protein